MKTIMCAVLLFAVPWRPVFAQDSVGELARILRDKGVITSSELTAVESSPGQERVRLLASLLEAKGVLTSVEVARLQMNSTNQVQTESASVVPAVYTPPPIANASAEPQAPPNGRETATAAPPVTSQSRFPVTVYGNILLNSFFDTSLNNIEDVPLFAGKPPSIQLIISSADMYE